MTRTKRTLLALSVPCLVAIAVPTVTACKDPSTPTFVNTLPPLGACIVQAAISDIMDIASDPLSAVQAVVSVCSQYGEVTIASILSYVEAAIAGQPALDGGLSAIHLARLQKIRFAAISQQHIVMIPSLVEAGAK